MNIVYIMAEPNAKLMKDLAHDNRKFDSTWTDKSERMYSKLPPQTKIHGSKRIGVVSDPMDMEMRKKLAATVAMTQGNSPLDPMNSEHVPNLASEHKKLKANLHKKGLAPVKKLRKKKEKGGYIFTSMKNTLVNPSAESMGVM